MWWYLKFTSNVYTKHSRYRFTFNKPLATRRNTIGCTSSVKLRQIYSNNKTGTEPSTSTGVVFLHAKIGLRHCRTTIVTCRWSLLVFLYLKFLHMDYIGQCWKPVFDTLGRRGIIFKFAAPLVEIILKSTLKIFLHKKLLYIKLETCWFVFATHLTATENVFIYKYLATVWRIKQLLLFINFSEHSF